MKLLLHACCGPCSLEPLRLFKEEGASPSLFYSNSNIHPQEEYERRLDTLKAWADGEKVPLMVGEYDSEEWERVVGIYGADRPARCRACYRLRFERAASFAASRGFDAISSTLSVSPYQFTGIIEEELERAAAQVGVQALFKDFRPFYPEVTRRSRELGMYRQNYCGCRFSFDEARIEREERKAARKAAKEERRRAREEALAAQAAQGAGVGGGVK